MPPGLWKPEGEGIHCVGPGDEGAKADALPQVLDSLETVENHDETVLGLWITLALSALIFVLSPWTLPKIAGASRGSRLGFSTFSPGYFWPAFLGEPPPVKMSEFTRAFGTDDAWTQLDPDNLGVVDADTFAEYAATKGLNQQKAEYIFRKLDCNMDTLLTRDVEFDGALKSNASDWEQVCQPPDRELVLSAGPPDKDLTTTDKAEPKDKGNSSQRRQLQRGELQRERDHEAHANSSESNSSQRRQLQREHDLKEVLPSQRARLLEQPPPPLVAGASECPPEAVGHEGELGDYLARLGGKGSLVALELRVKGLHFKDLAASQAEELQQSLARTVAAALHVDPDEVLDMQGQAAGLSLSGLRPSDDLVADGFIRLPLGSTLQHASERLRGEGTLDALVTETGENSYFELDSDGDGAFSLEEFAAAAKAYLGPGASLSGPAVEDLFDLLDIDLDGRLDGDEFFARRFRACALPQVGAAAVATAVS